MSHEVVFHRLAAREARDAEAWYAARSRDVAQRFRSAIDRAVEAIATDRQHHPIPSTRFRYVRTNRFPYRLIYWINAMGVATVVAVAHDRRRPGYWRRR